jgi:hypothetical protein
VMGARASSASPIARRDKVHISSTNLVQMEVSDEENQMKSSIPEDAIEEERNPEVEEAIAQLLTYASASELEAMLGPQAEEEEETDGSESESIQPKPLIQFAKQYTKQAPNHPKQYSGSVVHDGRKYHHKFDSTKKRYTKIAGPIRYIKDQRVATPKVPYKRKDDAAGHLIAHSMGGPPKFVGNFVAMNKTINSAGGDWGKMEACIRKRLKARNTTAYMSATPVYPNDQSKRPISIEVTVHFNRKPYKQKWIIPTP